MTQQLKVGCIDDPGCARQVLSNRNRPFVDTAADVPYWPARLDIVRRGPQRAGQGSASLLQLSCSSQQGREGWSVRWIGRRLL